MPKIIVLDNLAQEGLDLLAAAEGMEYEVRTGLAGEDLRAALATADGAICRSGVKITAESLEGNRRLRAIARAGVGTDNIDKAAATRLGIVVMNTPTGNTVSTAEHTFALMLGLSRNIGPAYQSLREGRWDRKKYMGTQLADKTLGIVGLGRIGQEVAARALAFEMRVIGYDPFVSPERCTELGIEPAASVQEMLPKVDYLTVHTPLTKETKGLIRKEQLELLKPGIRLVNCARGGIFDETALVEGLQSGKIAGVAVDVYEDEPCTDSPLFGMEGALCTPHLGASTEEAQTQVAVEAAQLLTNFFQTGEIRHAVNVGAIDPKTLESLKGYLDVAYRLGLLQAQWHDSPVKSCTVTYRGDIIDKNTKIITSAFCAGLIERALDEEVNIVNAEVLLRERGIQVTEQCRSDKGPFSSSVATDVTTDEGTFRAGGVLFGTDMPRLIRLADYRLESYLDGTLFIFEHKDLPGTIGATGAVFGRHNVNIAQMAVGRTGTKPGGNAIGVLNLDAKPTPEAVAEVAALNNISCAKVIELPPAGQLPPWLS